MHRTRYSKNPEFSGLGETVWKYLHGQGSTVGNILGTKDVEFSRINSDFVNRPVWYTKRDLDGFVERELNLNIRDYGTDMSKNQLYKAIANEIRYLRRSKLIVDLRRTEKRKAGIGIWRLADHAEAARIIAYYDMKGKDFGSNGHMGSAYVRAKQNEFRNILLHQYEQCLFCKFNLDRWMVGAHIVPYNTMREKDPRNAMHPSNGLLLCRMCDTAFEYGHVTVEEDYNITVSDYLSKHKTPAVRSWIDNIGTELNIRVDVSYKPDPKYLRWKKDLV